MDIRLLVVRGAFAVMMGMVLAFGCESPRATPAPAPLVRSPPMPPATITAKVCIHCTGPLAIDDRGRAIATLYLTVDARTAITNLRLDQLELTDDSGTVITRGTPREYLGMVTDPPIRDLGPFDGRLAAGMHVMLWTGAQLDAQDSALWKQGPTRYRLRVIADGIAIDIGGAMEPLGSTG
ncbi:MAG TPA: hypothetical protein VLB44_02270 [Kofleriaceae bacterium]|nr:hypothetical protein [Kofleriaceae bacterium]